MTVDEIKHKVLISRNGPYIKALPIVPRLNRNCQLSATVSEPWSQGLGKMNYFYQLTS